MASEKRLIDANAIPWEEHYVPDMESGKQWDYKKELCVLKPVIDQMPTVDAVEVVHGRWGIYDDGYGCELMCCSICKAEFYDGDNDTVDQPHNYCPNCGAKMDGERKDNERKAD